MQYLTFLVNYLPDGFTQVFSIFHARFWWRFCPLLCGPGSTARPTLGTFRAFMEVLAARCAVQKTSRHDNGVADPGTLRLQRNLNTAHMVNKPASFSTRVDPHTG
jgi:hypothetical protein